MQLTHHHLEFIWKGRMKSTSHLLGTLAPECTALWYIITFTDCGKCPDTTTHNSAICNEFSTSTNGTLCVFAIQSELCPGHIVYQTIGDMSSQIHVTLKGIRHCT